MHVESTDTLKGYMYGKRCMVADGGGGTNWPTSLTGLGNNEKYNTAPLNKTY